MRAKSQKKSMKQYLAIIAMDIKLALRLRAVIFFNYLFPLIFFFTFATVLRGECMGTWCLWSPCL